MSLIVGSPLLAAVVAVDSEPTFVLAAVAVARLDKTSELKLDPLGRLEESPPEGDAIPEDRPPTLDVPPTLSHK